MSGPYYEEYEPPPGPPPGYYAQQQQQQQQQQQYQYQQNHQANTAHPRAPPGFPSPPQQPAAPASQWNEHMFYSNGNGTPVFNSLMKEFFSKLDPQGTGYITPEAFSSFLDACHYRVDDNVWKRSRKGNMMFSADDMADFELKAALEGFYFDHKVVVRNPRAKQLPYGGMPLLSLEGFADFMSVEFCADIDQHLSGLNHALRFFGIWPEKGAIPRHVFLARCPPELQRRIDESSARCRGTAQTRLNAHKAQKQLELQGQQNALDLIDGPRRYYYY
ncbi:unnamed protein product [Clonostachys byssicola]|uniref:EF-hand domain-containing protein n=1 Tax=Clonostachys byssicola TaxID=160290 RepID=A0A9N9Y202_9HYPO|nr:unnamed protein product [Clonostachys byssicola]